MPVIGIVPSFDDGRHIVGGKGRIERVFLRRDYMNAIASVGALPIILSPEMTLETISQICDGIVISGGQDINPLHYNEEPLPELRDTEPDERFVWEKALICFCDDRQIPILGICYGLQRLNVHYGGSLIQDIPREIGTLVSHDNVSHEVQFRREFLGIHASEKREVASRHHQALGRLSENISVCAEAEDGVVEAAIFNERHFGMQWHPESDETGVHMYRAFVEKCMLK